ncbi:MAG TPA: hypothetical protein VGC21_08890 [Telluria sp.]|jgi:hypothetical protein
MNTDDLHDPELSPPLAHLRSSMSTLDTPRGVEKELMAAFAEQFPARRWYHALSPRRWALAGGTGGLAVLALLAVTMPLHAPTTGTGNTGAAHLLADDGPAFVALQPMERIEQEQHPRVLEADVPRTALASLGLPVSPEEAGDSVRAEMLVGADGAPLALRLVVSP